MTSPKLGYPIYDLTLRLLGERLLLLALNRVEEGKARMGEGGRDGEVPSSKKEKRIEDKSAKIDTLFMTKMVAK